jgi:glycine C-acetyltransferase
VDIPLLKVIELLRQRSRPYLFSNSLAPAIVGATIKVLNYWKRHHFKRQNGTPKYFKAGMVLILLMVTRRLLML